MPTDLGSRFGIDWRGRPPHMLAPDIPVWYRFLEIYGPRFRALYYDCLLGGPFVSPENAKDPMLRMWRATNAKRADAIAETVNTVWIVEVSLDPKQQALGQLLNYEALWLEDPKIDKPVELALVCERFDPDLTVSWAKHGVRVYVV